MSEFAKPLRYFCYVVLGYVIYYDVLSYLMPPAWAMSDPPIVFFFLGFLGLVIVLPFVMTSIDRPRFNKIAMILTVTLIVIFGFSRYVMPEIIHAAMVRSYVENETDRLNDHIEARLIEGITQGSDTVSQIYSSIKIHDNFLGLYYWTIHASVMTAKSQDYDMENPVLRFSAGVQKETSFFMPRNMKSGADLVEYERKFK